MLRPKYRKENDIMTEESFAWNSIIDLEVDGKNSIPYQKDKSNHRYDCVAGRKYFGFQ